MQAYTFEPMSISRILDNTFRIYKDNFIRFITIVAIIQIPLGLLSVVSLSAMYGFGKSNHQNSSQQINFNDLRNQENTNIFQAAGSFQNRQQIDFNPVAFIIGMIAVIITGILSILGYIFCSGALAKSISEIYLGNELTVGQAYSFVLPKFFTLLGAGFLVIMIFYAGLLLLVVPGVIFGLWFALTTPAIVIEDMKATQGMMRSKSLVSGNLGKIFSVLFLVFLISVAVSIPFNIIGAILGHFISFGNQTIGLFISQFVQRISQILTVPIGSITSILLYYDLRIRKEGFDLEMLARNINSGQGGGINVGQSYPQNSSEL